MIQSSETFDPVKQSSESFDGRQTGRSSSISKLVLLVPIIRTGPIIRTVLITGGLHCSFSLLHYPFYYVYILFFKKVYRTVKFLLLYCSSYYIYCSQKPDL
jgi:hypothetical protein